MNTFQLHLMSTTQSDRVPDLVHFTGQDAAGSFGIMANAFRRISALVYGLAHFRRASGVVEYLAMPGGLLYFVDNELRIATTQYVRGTGLTEVSEALDRQLRREDEAIRDIRQSLRHLDEQMMKRIFEMKRAPEP
jgi:F-type H+-transporting ATPase subunit epsilon